MTDSNPTTVVHTGQTGVGADRVQPRGDFDIH